MDQPIISVNDSIDPNNTIVLFIQTLMGESFEVISKEKLKKTLDINLQTVQIPFCIFYTIIFILGVSGNFLVCYVVYRNKAMRTVTNVFITNLALSDILLCLFAVPLTPMYTFLGKWIFGRLLCHLMPYVQGTSIYVSTLTLTFIARDRYYMVMYPFRTRMALSTCVKIIIFIWLFSVIMTCPYGLFISIQTINNEIYYCEEGWPSDKARQIFGVITTTIQFVIPFFVITFCYTFTSMKLKSRAQSRPGIKTSRREKLDRERKECTNRMLIILVAIFGISWLPLNLMNIFNDFFEIIAEWEGYFLTFLLAHLMAMASTIYNPFLYAWMNENFRKEFKAVLPCFSSDGDVRNIS